MFPVLQFYVLHFDSTRDLRYRDGYGLEDVRQRVTCVTVWIQACRCPIIGSPSRKISPADNLPTKIRPARQPFRGTDFYR